MSDLERFNELVDDVWEMVFGTERRPKLNKKTGKLDEIPLPDPEERKNVEAPIKGMNRNNVQKAN